MTDDKTPTSARIEDPITEVDPEDDIELDEAEEYDPAGSFLDENQDNDDTGDSPNGGI
jgi:hypothetical protein